MTRLGRHAEALQEWDRTLELEPGPARSEFRLQRALTLAHLGEHAKATAEADELAQAKDRSGGSTSYNRACVYALASAAARKDARQSPAECDRLAEPYAARAVEFLRSARAAGFFKDRAKVEHLDKDSDLEAIRSRADFHQLRSELEVEYYPGKKATPR